MTDPRSCGDCAAAPGEEHSDGCDVARCLVTGFQRLACNERHGCGSQAWAGEWPGIAECEEFGWWHDRSAAEMKRFEEWGMEVPRRTQNLNRLHPFSGEADWDPRACRWRRPGDPVDDTAHVHWHIERGLFLEPSARYTVDGVTLPAGELLARITGKQP